MTKKAIKFSGGWYENIASALTLGTTGSMSCESLGIYAHIPFDSANSPPEHCLHRSIVANVTECMGQYLAIKVSVILCTRNW